MAPRESVAFTHLAREGRMTVTIGRRELTSPSASAAACRGTRHRPGRRQASGAACERVGGLCQTWSLVGRRRQAHTRAATKSGGRRAAGIACAPSCSRAGTRTTIAAHRNVGGWVLMLAARITLPHFSVYAPTKLLNSVCEVLNTR